MRHKNIQGTLSFSKSLVSSCNLTFTPRTYKVPWFQPPTLCLTSERMRGSSNRRDKITRTSRVPSWSQPPCSRRVQLLKAAKSVRPSTHQPFNPPALQPTNPSTRQPFDPPTFQLTNPSTSQTLNKPTHQPFSLLAHLRFTPPAHLPTSPSIN